MSFEVLKSNIANEKEIAREIIFYAELSKSARNTHEKQLLWNAIASLKRKFNILNDAVPMLLENISLARKIPPASEITASKERPKEERLVSLAYNGEGSQDKSAVIKDIDKERFIKELDIGRELIKKIKTQSIEQGQREQKVKRIRTNLYAKLSNRFFSNLSNSLLAKGHFKNINKLQKLCYSNILIQINVLN